MGRLRPSSEPCNSTPPPVWLMIRTAAASASDGASSGPAVRRTAAVDHSTSVLLIDPGPVSSGPSPHRSPRGLSPLDFSPCVRSWRPGADEPHPASTRQSQQTHQPQPCANRQREAQTNLVSQKAKGKSAQGWSCPQQGKVDSDESSPRALGCVKLQERLRGGGRNEQQAGARRNQGGGENDVGRCGQAREYQPSRFSAFERIAVRR